MNAKQAARQREWAAKRAVKIGRPHPLRAPPKMLTAGDHAPDPGDYDRLLGEAPHYAWAIDSMVSGENPEFGSEIPKEYLGRTAVAAWQRGLAPDKLRALVNHCWGLGTPYVVEAAGRDLFAMLRACQFALPDELPDEVTVWRGARGVTAEQAGRGLCWTLDFEAACAWLRILELKWNVRGIATVVRRTVPRSAIAMYHRDGDLDEVVIENPPGVAIVDGTPSEWSVARVRWRDRMVAEGKMSMDGPSDELVPAMGGVFGLAPG